MDFKFSYGQIIIHPMQAETPEATNIPVVLLNSLVFLQK